MHVEKRLEGNTEMTTVWLKSSDPHVICTSRPWVNGKHRIPDFIFRDAVSQMESWGLSFWSFFSDSRVYPLEYLLGRYCHLWMWRSFFYILSVLYYLQIIFTIRKHKSSSESKCSAIWKWLPSSFVISSCLWVLRVALPPSRRIILVIHIILPKCVYCNSLASPLPGRSNHGRNGWRNENFHFKSECI